MLGRKLRIAVGICAHNEEDYIEYSIRAIYEFADVICISINTGRPWGGAAEPLDSTLNIVRSFPDPMDKIRIITGEWADEIEQRNASLDTVRTKADYYMIVDADEIYSPDDLAKIRKFIAWRPWVGQFRIRLNTYWKIHPMHVIRPPEPLKAYILTRVRLGTRFTGLRRTNEPWRCVIPRRVAIMHHFSYARPSERVQQKLANFSHKDQLVAGWFEKVWLAWDKNHSMEDLHPTNPPEYKRAVVVDRMELPEVMRDHPFM